jgi:predicted DNA binding CopG/RHH family protein
MKKLKKIPDFISETDEVEFWSKSDSTDFIDWSKSKKYALSNLKPSTKSISLRLPENMINDLKIIANRQDIPYQSLIKIILSERIKREFQ